MLDKQETLLSSKCFLSCFFAEQLAKSECKLQHPPKTTPRTCASPSGPISDTALHPAVISNDDVLSTLLRWSASAINAVDKAGYSALANAVRTARTSKKSTSINMLLNF